MKSRLAITVRLMLAVLLSGAVTSVASAQSATPGAAQAPATSAPAPDGAARQDGGSSPIPLPIDIEHVKKEAAKTPAVKLDDEQLRFYVLVVAKQVNFADFVGDYDLKYGPTRGGAAMTHQEFVDMTTPKELKELFGATSGSSFAMFQAALMNWAGQRLIKKAIDQLRGARSEDDVREIRERITRELSALDGKEP